MKKYFLQMKLEILIQILSDIISSCFTVVLPYIVKLFFDHIAGNKVEYSPIQLGLAYLLSVLMLLLFNYIHMLSQWRAGIKFEYNLKCDFFSAITFYSYERFHKKTVGQYLSIQDNDITAIGRDYIDPFLDIFKASSKILIFGAAIFMIVDYRVGIIIALTSLASALIAPNILAKNISKKRTSYLNEKESYVSVFQDILSGFKFIRKDTFNSFRERYQSALEKAILKKYSLERTSSLASSIRLFLNYIMNILSYSVIGYLLVTREISVASGVAALTYISYFKEPIESLIYDVNTILTTKDLREKVFELLSYVGSEKILVKNDISKSIEINNLSIENGDFKIKNFSYKFLKGKKYALIGHNGSGKSTILKALAQKISVRSGDVLIDGLSCSSFDLSELIWCIDQNEHFFSDGFNNNLTIFSSFEKTSLDDIINLIGKEKYNSMIGQENCRDLSGGQKQTLSIMRSYLVKRQILLMDEPLSAVDKKLSKKIHKLLLSIENKTIIMVTHDLGDNLSNFDEIIIMKNGQITKSGSYSSIKNSKEFLDLCVKIDKPIDKNIMMNGDSCE